MSNYINADLLPREWANPKALARLPDMQMRVARARNERRTACLILGDRSFFLRIYGRMPWHRYLRNLLSLRNPIRDDAGPESRALLRLAEAGVPAPLLVACQQTSGLHARGVTSMLLMTDLGEHLTVADLISSWLITPPSPMTRRNLIGAVGELVGAMHRAGVDHRDLYSWHLVYPSSGGRPVADAPLYLIDMHRSRVRARLPRRWQIKDLARLWSSAFSMCPRRLDLLRFLRAYSPDYWRHLARDTAFRATLRYYAKEQFTKLEFRNLQRILR